MRVRAPSSSPTSGDRRSGRWFGLALAVGLACQPATHDPSPTVVPEALEPVAVSEPPASEASAVVPGPAVTSEPEETFAAGWRARLCSPTWTPEPPPTSPGFTPAELQRIVALQPIVDEVAAEHGVDRDLVNGIIFVESRFQTKARGGGGAAGLMQLMPRTSAMLARSLKVPHRPYDARFNVTAGAHYIARLSKRFDGDIALAIAGYARGIGRVREWLEADGVLPDPVCASIDRMFRGRHRFVLARRQGLLPDSGAAQVALAPQR